MEESRLRNRKFDFFLKIQYLTFSLFIWIETLIFIISGKYATTSATREAFTDNLHSSQAEHELKKNADQNLMLSDIANLIEKKNVSIKWALYL